MATRNDVSKQRPSNPRQDRRHFEKQLVAAFVVLLVVVGGGAIWWRYGAGAALTGLLCALSLFAIVGLLWAILILFERIAE